MHGETLCTQCICFLLNLSVTRSTGPAGDELVATELIFGGVLADLEPEEAVALLSALVFQAS